MSRCDESDKSVGLSKNREIMSKFERKRQAVVGLLSDMKLLTDQEKLKVAELHEIAKREGYPRDTLTMFVRAKATQYMVHDVGGQDYVKYVAEQKKTDIRIEIALYLKKPLIAVVDEKTKYVAELWKQQGVKVIGVVDNTGKDEKAIGEAIAAILKSPKVTVPSSGDGIILAYTAA